MLDWLRRKKARPTSSNRVDELANVLAQQGKFADLEAKLAVLDHSKLSESELESWYYFRGVAAFRREDRPLAKQRFLKAHALFPHSAMIAFSLGQEHEYIGDTASMFDLFDRTSFPKLPASHALAQSRYAYLWGDINRAIAYVEPILEMHCQLGIADDTFLYIRRMPSFGQTWAYMAAFHELQGDLSRLEAITQNAAAHLQHDDLSQYVDFLSCMKAKDFSRYATRIQHGTSYERVSAAVILSLGEKSYLHARDILDSVQLPDSDSPWLHDILLVAKCEAAHRCEPSAEPELVERFFLHQPLLFEPDHAVNFRILGYQEHLKPLYQARRRANQDIASSH